MTPGPPAPADPVVVLVPGLGLDGRAWRRVGALLPGRHRVVGLPSLGRRAARGVDLRVEPQADRLLAELPVDGTGGVVLVGHSASCPVVVEAAVRADHVVGLVLVGPVTDPRARTWPAMVAQWLRTASHERLRELPVLVPQYGRTGPIAMVRGMTAVRRYRTDHTLARLRLPVVVVRGSRDRIAPQDWSGHLAVLAGGRLDTVEGAAHMVPLTHPDAVATVVRDVGTARGAAGRGPSTPTEGGFVGH